MTGRPLPVVPGLLSSVLLLAASAAAQAPADTRATTDKVRISGTVSDIQTATTLPVVTVEVAGAPLSTTTNVDGAYVLDVPAGLHQLRLCLPGFQPRTVDVDAGTGKAEGAFASQSADLESVGHQLAQAAVRLAAGVTSDRIGVLVPKGQPTVGEKIGRRLEIPIREGVRQPARIL